MTRYKQISPANRREILQLGALLSGVRILQGSHPAVGGVTTPATVRDRLWLWAHDAGSHNNHWNLPGNSRITPVEAAYYMSIPNIIFVRYEGKPAEPFQQYAIPFRALREVVWSVVGAGGATEDAEREIVLNMAKQNLNFSGVMMDDFFTGNKEGKLAALTVEDLQKLQKRLKDGPKKLDLWVVLYAHQLEGPVTEHLKYCDVLTFWTWKSSQLEQLSPNFEKAEKIAPAIRKVLGCYMWDYGDKKPMPLSAMRNQCEQGLKWLQQGRIEDMIFLASCICDLELEAVEWTRKWIQQVGARKLVLRKSARKNA